MKVAMMAKLLLLALVGLTQSQAFMIAPSQGVLGRTTAARSAAAASGPRMMLPFAGAIAAHIVSNSPLNPDHLIAASPSAAPQRLVAVKETREGLYQSYTVDVDDKAPVDLGKSTFKKKEETEVSRDKYVAVLGVLLAGSFIIPMVQYWWYIRDDDRPIE